MCVVNDYILIASRNQSIIQVYSKKGNFLYQISNKGNGPKDYLEIATFTATNTSIYALDNYTHKISQYNINTGEFIKKQIYLLLHGIWRLLTIMISYFHA